MTTYSTQFYLLVEERVADPVELRGVVAGNLNNNFRVLLVDTGELWPGSWLLYKNNNYYTKKSSKSQIRHA